MGERSEPIRRKTECITRNVEFCLDTALTWFQQGIANNQGKVKNSRRGSFNGFLNLQVLNNTPVVPSNRNRYPINFNHFRCKGFNFINRYDKRPMNPLEKI